jgi:hypothetical protein
MYYARGMKDILKHTELSIEFFEALDEFQLQFIELCFRQALEDQMGMMTEVEEYNYQLFEEYKSYLFAQKYGIDESYWKKAG